MGASSILEVCFGTREEYGDQYSMEDETLSMTCEVMEKRRPRVSIL